MGGIIEANREPVQYRAGEGRRKRKGEEEMRDRYALFIF